MSDVRIIEVTDLSGVTMDWLLSPAGLDDTQELATAIIVALGTDGTANPEDELPDLDSDDRRGWWGNLDRQAIWNGWNVGSRLWTLARSKITDQNARQGALIARAIGMAQEALQPFIAAGIASKVNITGERVGVNAVTLTVTMYRGPLAAIELRYQYLWDQIRG